MANAVRIHVHGGPEALVYEQVDDPEPAAGEVLVRQRAVGLNFIDTYHRSGLYEVPRLPSGIGVEAAGEVVRVGEDVSGFRSGDRVAYATPPPGAYADLRAVPAHRLVPLPDDVPDVQAAGIMLKGMTVEYLIRRTFQVREGTSVLWHAAAGGVGSIACQWLRALGAVVIGTVGSRAKAEVAKAAGCDHVVRYDEEDVPARVRELTDQRGVDVVYDGVGEATWAGSLDSLRRRGMMVSFGNASGEPPALRPIELSHKGSLYLTRPKLFDYTADREELLQSAGALFQVVRSGQVKVEVERTYPLKEAARAHADLEARRLTGSTVLLPDPAQT